MQLNFDRVLSFLSAEWASAATAAATIALAFLTWALVRATNRMAQATSRPQVIANLEVNQWSPMYIDLVIQNAGMAPAFDISLSFRPDIPMEGTRERLGMGLPLREVSLLRPGQKLVSFVTSWSKIQDETFEVRVSWARVPGAKAREQLRYSLNLGYLRDASTLGRSNPAIQIAEQLKKLREDWRPVAQGQRRTEVDMFDNSDREKEEKRLEAKFNMTPDE